MDNDVFRIPRIIDDDDDDEDEEEEEEEEDEDDEVVYVTCVYSFENIFFNSPRKGRLKSHLHSVCPCGFDVAGGMVEVLHVLSVVGF